MFNSTFHDFFDEFAKSLPPDGSMVTLGLSVLFFSLLLLCLVCLTEMNDRRTRMYINGI